MAVVVRAFLLGCAVLLLVVGCAGTSSETSNKKEQGSSPKATESEEEGRCEGTRKINMNLPARFTTNDLPGCPKGGLLLGTDKPDELAGEKGNDEVRGLGGSDDVEGGPGNDILYGGPGDDAGFGGDGDDVIYGGPGDDCNLSGDKGEDVIYAGPGDDTELNVSGVMNHGDGQRDKLYCGEGRDTYYAEKIDYVDSSCEVKLGNVAPGPDLPPKGGVF